MKWLKNLLMMFQKKDVPLNKPKISIKDLSLLDDIWVKEDEEIYKGWVWDISRRCITVVYGEDLRDFKFQIPRPMNVSKIVQGNKILYCNKQGDDN